MYVALFVVVVILALLLGRIPSAAHVDFEAGATESGPDLSANAIESSPEPELRSDTSGLYLIIDDVGNNLSALADYLDLQIDITFAVLPGRRHTVESVRRIREAGQAVILHQPMEPVGVADPGFGALYTGMSLDEVAKTIDENLAKLPDIKGINNHMGSLATSDSLVMNHLMSVLADRDMFFIDSVTTGKSVAASAAFEFGVQFARRSARFLDNIDEASLVLEALESGLEVAREEGDSILIGHVQSASLAELLRQHASAFEGRGYAFRHVSEYPSFSE